jgi:DNA-directed RNA polymerase subunit RPC12/RpoP
MIGKIYFIKSHVDKHILYIGSTVTSLNNRFNLHYNNYKNNIHTCSLNSYFDKYGIESFYIELYKQYRITDKHHLLALEQLAINKFKLFIINKNNPFGLGRLKPKHYKKIIYNKYKDTINENKRLDYLLNKDKYKNKYYNNINYYKQYRITNTEKLNEKSKEYRKKNLEYFIAYSKLYRNKNKTIIKNNKKLFYINHKEHINAKSKLYYNNNKDKIKLNYLKKKEENKDKYNCEYCNYITHNKYVFNTHLKSNKHIKNSNDVLKDNIQNNTYYIKNKDKINLTSKMYYHNNKDKLKLYYLKKKEENKDKYKCEYCNYKTYCNNYFNTHLKSKKHINNSMNLLNTKY